MNDEQSSLKARIRQLEHQLNEKEQDLTFFKNELSRVNQRLAELSRRMKLDLQGLSKMQKFLVPTEFPNIPGFEFSTKFSASPKAGGDYFDLFDCLEKMKFDAVVACSSGYSTSAVLMSVLLKYSGSRALRQSGGVASAVQNIVTDVMGHFEAIDGISLLWGTMDRRQFDFEYALLGAIKAYYYEFETKTLQRLEATGARITQDFDQKIVTSKVSLNANDRVIICSEGFLQTTNLSGELWSEEELYQTIRENLERPVHELRNEIFYANEKFSEGVEWARDRTVVVMEAKDKVIKLAKIEAPD